MKCLQLSITLLTVFLKHVSVIARGRNCVCNMCAEKLPEISRMFCFDFHAHAHLCSQPFPEISQISDFKFCAHAHRVSGLATIDNLPNFNEF